jgi:hypothetical protein
VDGLASLAAKGNPDGGGELAVSRAALEVASIQPSGKYAYVDTIWIWLKKPLKRTQLPEWLKLALTKDRSGKQRAHLRNHPLSFNPVYRQRLKLQRPPSDQQWHNELRWLATLKHVLITRVDVALDWTFDDPLLLVDAKRAVIAYLIKLWHRNHIAVVKDTTRYYAPATSRTVLLVYADKECRVTGEVYCVHIELRLKSSGRIKRAGLGSVTDLLQADWTEFWEHNLDLRAVEGEKLGRQWNVKSTGSKRRKPWVTVGDSGLRYNRDARTGGVLIAWAGLRLIKRKGYGWINRKHYVAISTQRVVDKYRNRIPVNKCLVRLDVTHLLPERETVRVVSEKTASSHEEISTGKRVSNAGTVAGCVGVSRDLRVQARKTVVKTGNFDMRQGFKVASGDLGNVS